MATFTIRVDDSQVNRVVLAISETVGWTPEWNITRAQATRNWLMDQVKIAVKTYESQIAAQTAGRAAAEAVEAEIVIT